MLGLYCSSVEQMCLLSPCMTAGCVSDAEKEDLPRVQVIVKQKSINEREGGE